jgi:hypothetical protein
LGKDEFNTTDGNEEFSKRNQQILRQLPSNRNLWQVMIMCIFNLVLDKSTETEGKGSEEETEEDTVQVFEAHIEGFTKEWIDDTVEKRNEDEDGDCIEGSDLVVEWGMGGWGKKGEVREGLISRDATTGTNTKAVQFSRCAQKTAVRKAKRSKNMKTYLCWQNLKPKHNTIHFLCLDKEGGAGLVETERTR